MKCGFVSHLKLVVGSTFARVYLEVLVLHLSNNLSATLNLFIPLHLISNLSYFSDSD